MKKILVLATLALSATALAQSAPTTLTLNWTNTDAAYGPVCPATPPVLCLGSIEAEDITSLTPVVMSAAIAYNATSYVYTFPTTPTYGNHTYAVFATGFNATGVAIQSGNATATVDVEPKLNAPVITLATAK